MALSNGRYILSNIMRLLSNRMYILSKCACHSVILSNRKYVLSNSEYVLFSGVYILSKCACHSVVLSSRLNILSIRTYILSKCAHSMVQSNRAYILSFSNGACPCSIRNQGPYKSPKINTVDQVVIMSQGSLFWAIIAKICVRLGKRRSSYLV